MKEKICTTCRNMTKQRTCRRVSHGVNIVDGIKHYQPCTATRSMSGLCGLSGRCWERKLSIWNLYGLLWREL